MKDERRKKKKKKLSTLEAEIIAYLQRSLESALKIAMNDMFKEWK